MKQSLGLDLTVYSSKYKGGVTSFTEGVITGILKQLENWDVTIYCRLENFGDVCNKFGNYQKIVVLEPSFKSVYEKCLKITYKFRLNYIFYVMLQNIFWYKSISKIKNETQVLYIPSTYLNFPSKRISSFVSLHDTQEKSFPANFSSNQLAYRKIQTLTTLKYSKLIQCSSFFIKKEIEKYFYSGTQISKIVVIPEGVDTSYFSFHSKDIKATRFRIFFPSSFLKHKNHGVLVDALKLLDKTTSLVIRFTGEKNELRNEIEAKCLTFKNIECSFIGAISNSDLLSEYSQSDLVISCSKYESSSLPILEGIAVGRTVLASDIDAHIEMARHLPIIIFKQDDPINLASLIGEIIVNSAKENFLKDSLNHSIKQFDWNIIVKDYEKCFSLLS